jgi:hypothetical protein
MSQAKRTVKKAVWGLAFIAAGALLLMSNYGAIAYQFSFRNDWPVILVLIGLSELLDSA